MDARAHFDQLARYHVWATERLLQAIEPLDDAAYRRDLGLFFRSIHGTLNHLLVAEGLLWLRRFGDGVSPQVALDAEVEPDRARLATRLLEGARAWRELIAHWPESRYAGRIDYTTMRGVPVSLPFAATLAHAFNHATHHRGQISAALTALGQPGPVLDLVYLLQQEAA